MQISRRLMLQSMGISSLGIAACCCGCKTAPVTGRRQFMMIPESQEMSLGVQAYQEVLNSEPVSKDQQMAQIVQRVGTQIANVSGRTDFQWEFNLISSPTQNAFCLPGGKVAVYEGILPVCENEAGLAVVMSHEVAHALARHGGERMSQSLIVDSGQKIADTIARKNIPDRHEQLMQAYSIGSKYGVLLPYNRKQESEADHIGVLLMAKAGYDPTEAPKFWNRFGGATGQEQQVEFFSTHPSDNRRAADLLRLMEEAQQHYAQAPQKVGVGQSLIRATG